MKVFAEQLSSFSNGKLAQDKVFVTLVILFYSFREKPHKGPLYQSDHHCNIVKQKSFCTDGTLGVQWDFNHRHEKNKK